MSNKTLTPFQRNAKGDKLDLNKPEDIELTINRNKKLEKAVSEGINVWDIKFYATLYVTFECYKCGCDVEVEHRCESEDESFGTDYKSVFRNCRCAHCHTSYIYSYGDDTLTARPPKPKALKQLKTK